MFQKRKKFKEEATPETRLSDRWDQQVFFMKRTYPQSESAIVDIIKDHGGKEGAPFVPSEEALLDLAKLNDNLRGL